MAKNIYDTITIDSDGIRLDNTGIKAIATGTEVEITDYDGQFHEVTFTVYANHVNIADHLPRGVTITHRTI